MPTFDLSLAAPWEQVRGLLQTDLESLHTQLDQLLTVSHAADGTLNAAASAAFTLAPVVITTTATGAQHNFDISSANGADVLLRCNNTASLDFTGFRGGRSGQLLTIVSVAANEVTLSHQNALSVGPNRLWNQATVGLTRIAPNINDDSTQRGVAVYLYDVNGNANNAGIPYWRLITHDQGAWITPAYAAGDFTGNGAMTWDVAAGDRTTLAYYLRGRSLHVTIDIITASVGGVVNSDLRVGNGQWGGFTASAALFEVDAACLVGDNSTAKTVGLMYILASGTTINIQKPDGSNWTLTVNNNHVIGQMSFEVK